MKLVIKTQVYAILDNALMDFVTREYVTKLNKAEASDPVALERRVYQAGCRIEKHTATLHEHITSWYVIPDHILPDSEQKQLNELGEVQFDAHRID